MFASLKNKIREETGSDLSKLTAKITSSTVQRIDSLRGRGSTTSINSIVSSDSLREDNGDVGKPVDEDYKKRIGKVEAEFARKLDDKEREWREIVAERDKRLQCLEKEKDEAYKQIHNLKDSLKNAEDCRQKLVERQEDKEQIENFQTQELAKVKHLVLLREQELEERTAAYKDATQQIEKLRSEVNRLRRYEEQLSDVQQNVNTEIKAVRKNLENTESELEKNEDECSKLRVSVESEHQANNSLRQVITKLEKELKDEKANSLNVQRTLTRVTAEKNTALLRNAEISQQMEIVKQDTRRQEMEMNDLLSRISVLEEENKRYKEKETKGIEQELRNTVVILEEQLSDKNKNIKTLQLRLADMKKTLQQELRGGGGGTTNHSNFYDASENNSAAILTPSQNTTRHHQYTAVRKDDEDVNFTYLKHVIIKFLTSREYEAQHLTRAVATLLKFSPEEEKLLNDTLEWKMSWFGSRPKIDDK